METERRRLARWSLVFMLLVLGWRLLLIACFGNATPSWDQWEAEANQLYVPWLQGRLDWRQLIAPFNEHRLFCTRVLDLLLLKLNGGIWNCLLQMVVDCLIHVMALGLLVYGLLQCCPAPRRPLFWAWALVLFLVPFGQENLLWGFQSQFYFLLLFSMLSIYGLARQPPRSGLWWLSLLVAPLCMLSLASGVLTLATASCLLVLRWQGRGRPGLVEPVLAVILLGLALAGWLTTPVTRLGEVYRSHSPEAFLDGLNRASSWPFLPWSCLIIYQPLAMTCWSWWRQRLQPQSPDWFLLGMGLWLLTQLAGIAYGRAVIVQSSRYQDIMVLGLLLNGLCLLRNYRPVPGGGLRSRYRFWMLWLALVVLGAGLEMPEMTRHIAYRAESGAAQEVKLRSWLASDRRGVLKGRPAYDLPHPSAERLQQLLDIPELRSILPDTLVPSNADREPALIRWYLAHQLTFAILILFSALVPAGVGWRSAVASGRPAEASQNTRPDNDTPL